MTSRVSHVAHVAMAVAMVAMAWRGELVLGWLQSGLFTATALWFALRAVAARAGRWANVHHAVLATAMTWMTAAPGHHGHVAAGPTTLPVSRVLAVYCAFTTCLWLLVAMRRRRLAPVGHAVMAAVMGLTSSPW